METIVEVAKKIEDLKNEMTALKAREGEIEAELQMLWQRMHEFSPVPVVPEQRRKRYYPPRVGVPRTFASKVLIGTGRRVIEAASQELDVEIARKNAMDAAHEIAKKYGEELTEEIIRRIEEQIAMRYT